MKINSGAYGQEPLYRQTDPTDHHDWSAPKYYLKIAGTLGAVAATFALGCQYVESIIEHPDLVEKCRIVNEANAPDEARDPIQNGTLTIPC